MPLLVLLGVFVMLPIVEIYVIIQVGQQIGALPTILLLIFESLLGGWIVKREGRRAWQALTDTISSGRVPGKELADAALVLVGGTLLLTPGFVTDIVGFFLVLPFTRPTSRRLVMYYAGRRVAARTSRAGFNANRSGVYKIYQEPEDDPRDRPL